MANVNIVSAPLGGNLQSLLMSDDIQPGSEPSYQLCKTIYTYHPLGKRLVDGPLEMALSKPRLISVPDAPDDVATKAFQTEWDTMRCDHYIMNTMRLSKIYGISTIAMSCEEYPDNVPIPPEEMYKINLNFRVYDPLNTAGSLVLDLNPQSPHFLKPEIVRVANKPFHPSRTCVVMNEDPVYLSFTSSAFGYVGRSIYQRALYPLKSFISSLIADDLVARKCGVIVAKIKQPGSIVNNISTGLFAGKRNIVKEAETTNVISIGPDEDISSIDLNNIEGALMMSRKHIIANIASAANMPEHILSQEKLSNGFESGGEDFKIIADYIAGVQNEMIELFDYFTKIVQRKAWNPEFYTTVQNLYPEQYGDMSYDEFFYDCKNKFATRFPELIEEREEKRLDTEKLKTETIVNVANAFLPTLDPDNQAILFQWCADNLNALKMIFPDELQFDLETFRANAEEQKQKEDQKANQEQMQAMQHGGNFGGDPNLTEGNEVADDSMPKLVIGKLGLTYEYE